VLPVNGWLLLVVAVAAVMEANPRLAAISVAAVLAV